MHRIFFEALHREELITDASLERIGKYPGNRQLNIHWELKTIVYTGILLLTTGLGILVYKNIDTIGHQAILALIASICIASFLYCERKKLPFSRSKVFSPDSYFDYVLLLGCLTLLIFIAYLQAQYNVFGTAYGLATFIPMVILFFCAYYFDHLGVLSMAITNLAAWAGLAVTPLQIFRANNFADSGIIFAGLAVGSLLTLVAELSVKRGIKAHFAFTYLNFGMNILFVSCLAAMFYFDNFYLLWIFPFAAITWLFYNRAVKISSFYFILMIVLYTYVAIGYVFIRLLDKYLLEAYMLLLLYFIGSGVYMVIFLINMNKKIKSNDRLQS